MSFAVTLCLHAATALGFYVALMGRSPEVIPIFKSGDSGLVFALPEQPEPVPEAASVPVVEQVPEPDPVPDPELPQPAEAPLQKQEEAQPQKPSGLRGDSADRGVESAYVGLTEISPKYPLGSRLRGEEGVVMVKAKINRHGRAENVEIARSSGYKALDRAAEDAMKNARFVATDDSNPAGAEVQIPFRFKLRD
ncbi:MAG: hypothetical protein C0404_13610 [Verrucomicrobia bacterium]|nr:hypothetical protein [Verrucomicrobiota bacterium]